MIEAVLAHKKLAIRKLKIAVQSLIEVGIKDAKKN